MCCILKDVAETLSLFFANITHNSFYIFEQEDIMHCNWTCTHKNSQLGRHFSEISVYIKYCQIRHTQKRDFTNTKITDWDLTLKYSIIFDCDPNTEIFYKYCLLTQIEIVYNLILHPTLRYSTIIALDFTLSYSAILDWDPTFKYPKIIGWN